MDVFNHHVYEYKRGLRKLILYTENTNRLGGIKTKLKQSNIDYVIYHVTEQKINVFFGDKACVGVIKQIAKSSLTDYSDEEDFILGTMLGYDLCNQCKRFLKRKNRKSVVKLIG